MLYWEAKKMDREFDTRRVDMERNYKEHSQRKMPAIFRQRGCQTYTTELSRKYNTENGISKGKVAVYEGRDNSKENIKTLGRYLEEVKY
jgi:hypothetical protein